jgi:hypothetical protein
MQGDDVSSIVFPKREKVKRTAWHERNRRERESYRLWLVFRSSFSDRCHWRMLRTGVSVAVVFLQKPRPYDSDVVGKTFKGLTDAEFQTMKKRFLALERSRRGGTVSVRPAVVVEVLFNEIQASSQYESGLALRFARITRIREDKPAAEADTLQTLRQLFDQ